jgi:hypothetical protein
MIANSSSVPVEKREKILESIVQEIHDRTIIGFIIKTIKDTNAPCSESLIYNRTIEHFSELRKISGGPYTGDPINA